MPRSTSRLNRALLAPASGLPDVSLMLADFTSHTFPPHVHDAMVVAITEEGAAEFTSRGTTAFAYAGSILAFNPAEAHAGRLAGSPRWRYRAFYVSQPAVARLVAQWDTGASPYFESNLIDDRTFAQQLLTLHRQIAAGEDCADAFTSALGHLAVRGASRGRPPAARRATLAKALRLIHEHYDEPLRLADLTDAVGLSPWQLIEAFRAAYGLTPHAYLNQVRVHAAARLLRRTGRAADVAASCGFYDQSALLNHFKRCFGVTPGQYSQAFTGKPAHAEF